MHITDTIADMLTRIRNANSAKHDTVDIPASKMKTAIAQILSSSTPPLPDERQHFAADVFLAGPLVGDDALGGGEDSYAEPLQHSGHILARHLPHLL